MRKLIDRSTMSVIGRMTWPAFVELVLSAMFGMVDMIMLGQLARSDVAIAAVGLTNNPMNLMLGVFAAVNVGTTTTVAWHIGAEQDGQARMAARQSLMLNLLLGFAVGVIGISFAGPIVSFMGADMDTLVPARHYLQIVTAGLPFMAVNLAVTAALRGAGLTRLPMLYNLVSNLLNVFGNYVLIYGKFGAPAMGVEGAAISTTLSRILGCFMALGILFFSRTRVQIHMRESWRLQKDVVQGILKIGLPASLEQFVLQTGFVLFARTVSGLGTTIFAAHQIGLSICGLTFAPSNAFGVATTTLVGQSLGAGNREAARKYAGEAQKMAMFFACLVGILFLFFSHQLAALYTADVAVAALAGGVIKLMALAQPGQSSQLTLAGALRGAGDTRYPLYASIGGIWIFRVFVAWLFVQVFHWGLYGAWFSILLDQYTRAVIVYARYRSGLWLNKKLPGHLKIEKSDEIYRKC